MTALELVNRLPSLRALVVGDICLDRWCTYDPRLADRSRETGLDRVAVVSTQNTPGGGGAVANNLAALGLARVAVLGSIGCDGNGYELVQALEERGIDTGALLRDRAVTTFTYTKLINRRTGVEDLPRIDYVQADPLPDTLQQQLAQRLLDIHGGFDLLLVADQSEISTGGVVTQPVRRTIEEIGSNYPDKVILGDSRMRCELFRRVTMKINRAEAEAACQRAFAGLDYEQLCRHLCARRLFITDGPNGIVVLDAGRKIFIPAGRIEHPVDTCGAGDSFLAGAGCALALGADAELSAQFGDLVASVTIMKPGTGTASPDELRRILRA